MPGQQGPRRFRVVPQNIQRRTRLPIKSGHAGRNKAHGRSGTTCTQFLHQGFPIDGEAQGLANLRVQRGQTEASQPR